LTACIFDGVHVDGALLACTINHCNILHTSAYISTAAATAAACEKYTALKPSRKASKKRGVHVDVAQP
jgi:hypothetical protein